VSGLGGTPRFHTAALIAQTTDLLAAEKHERGRAVIVAVDEAHLLSPAQLEELRLLTNSEMDSVAPFAGLLLGQPTLRRRIKSGQFAALDQRVALRYALPGMTPTETRDYLAHHLKLVGRDDQMFSDDAAALIHHTSRGLPRAINNLGLQAPVATYATNKTIVDESAARAAVAEVTAEQPPKGSRRHADHHTATTHTKGPLPHPGGGLHAHPQQPNNRITMTPSASPSVAVNRGRRGPWCGGVAAVLPCCTRGCRRFTSEAGIHAVRVIQSTFHWIWTVSRVHAMALAWTRVTSSSQCSVAMTGIGVGDVVNGRLPATAFLGGQGHAVHQRLRHLRTGPTPRHRR
jgi:hypothetical protein